MKAAIKAQDAEEKAAVSGVKGMEAMAGKTMEAVGATLKMGGAMLGLSSAQGVISIFVDQMDRARAYTTKTADEIQRIRGGIRELQALRGDLGKTSPGIAHVFGVTAKTLQKPEEVQAMESAAIGIGELALKTPQDKAEFDKAMIAAGKLQSLEGGSPDAYGELMGRIALNAKNGINAEDMEGKLDRLYQIQKPGGFRNMTQAIGQFSKLSAEVSNGILSEEEAMGLVSGASASGPADQAGTSAQQLARAVLAGRIKARGMKIAEGVNAETTADYMEGLGIKEGDSALTHINMIAADIDAQKKNNPNANIGEYMITRGFGNAEDAMPCWVIPGCGTKGS